MTRLVANHVDRDVVDDVGLIASDDRTAEMQALDSEEPMLT